MTRKQINKDKINKEMVIKAIRDVADELFKLDELLEGIEIAPEWLGQGYPFADDISERKSYLQYFQKTRMRCHKILNRGGKRTYTQKKHSAAEIIR